MQVRRLIPCKYLQVILFMHSENSHTQGVAPMLNLTALDKEHVLSNLVVPPLPRPRSHGSAANRSSCPPRRTPVCAIRPSHRTCSASTRKCNAAAKRVRLPKYSAPRVPTGDLSLDRLTPSPAPRWLASPARPPGGPAPLGAPQPSPRRRRRRPASRARRRRGRGAPGAWPGSPGRGRSPGPSGNQQCPKRGECRTACRELTNRH
mmetsp:Transcript_18817/g.50019  ORF Transcript_18817/g.50019 Transcript_18817/m.50019 type:complete len:205 (-) Transcript_18817:148-762(-)